jgi:hypothetical protein
MINIRFWQCSQTLAGAVAAVLLAAAAAQAASSSSGQFYPSRPLRFIVGFVSGGVADLLARALALRLTDAWGQQAIVDNRSGGGVISMQIAGRAAPDGYTLLMGSSTQFSINPALRPSLPLPLGDDAGSAQFSDGLRLHAEHIAQHFFGVLAQRGRHAAYGCGRFG